jgi:outer membrane protein TolC
MLGLLFGFLLVSFFVKAVHGKTFKFDDYVNMIVENNIEIKAIQANIDSVENKLFELKKVYACSLSAIVNYNSCKSRLYSETVELNEKPKMNYDASIGKKFTTGTQIYFGLNKTSNRHSSMFLGKSRGINGLTTLFAKLEQSIWKDINGKFTKASIAKAIADAKSTLFKLEYKKQNVLCNAINAYWDLSYSREVVNFKKLSLNRVKKIMAWTQKKYSMGLTERSDLLHSQIAVKSRELDLKLAYEEENRSNRIFNQFLNFGDAAVAYEPEELLSKKNNFIENKVLVKKAVRSDVLSAFEDVKSASRDYMTYKKNSCGDLILRGHCVLNNANSLISWSKPSCYVEIAYTLPLDFKLRKAVERGYQSAEIAAQEFAKWAEIQEKVDWIQIVDNWNNANVRLCLSIEIEDLERQKHLENRFLFSRGRLTTYQVLQSEQDLDDATLKVLQNILELVKIQNRAKAFYSVS